MQSVQMIRLETKILDLKNGVVMGILNLTPDSFYKESRFSTLVDAQAQIDQMIGDGVDILDVGAFSSRPGAELVSEEEEWERLQPILKMLRDEYSTLPISLDTYRSEIASRAVLEYGVSLINDISAGRFDEKMPEIIAKLQVPVVLMHMQGTPGTMQENPSYHHVLTDVLRFFGERIQVFRDAGVHDIILDPGFGFGKTLKHNYILINSLDSICALGLPVLVGVSRKSMIYKSIGVDENDALNGTTALHAICRLKGANIFRVHDVKEAVECLCLSNQVIEPELLS